MKKYVIERWTGKAWQPSLCSPYNTISDVRKHLAQYSWHYTEEYPYRITDFKPKKQVKYFAPKKNLYQDWNSDKGMIVSYK